MSATNQSIIDQLGGSETDLWCPSKDETSKPADVLSNKIVLLYFSAHWCPPCRRFTPILIELYRKLKAQGKEEDFELVFCSMDRTEAEYKSYCAEMPWWALPQASPVMGKLANKYGAQGIPHLVVLDKDGSVMVQDGVGRVTADPEGNDFPWRPKPVVDLLPDTYIDSDKNTVLNMADLKDKYLMLYFSAHWCPPCKQFTPKLSAAYKELKKSKTDFELLFVSSDRNESAFNDYFGEMTFCALPYSERQAKEQLSTRLDVRGIPKLVMLGPVPADGGDRPIINDNVRPIIDAGNYIADFPFVPKPYGDLAKAGDELNTCRCLVIFHEGGDDEEQEEIQTAIKTVAEKKQQQQQKNDMRYYWALSPGGVAKTIRDALKLGPMKEEPCMVIVDVPDQGSFYKSSETEITVESIQSFLDNPGEKHKL